jgi:ABC-type sugar transport system permease subunit
MTSLTALLHGFEVALTAYHIGLMVVGVLIGILVGVLPGLGAPNGVALLLPLTFFMPPVSAIILLSSMYWGALLGGSTDQMISYFVADNMGRSLNWGLASALAAILLGAVLVLYAVYDRLVGANNLKLG